MSLTVQQFSLGQWMTNSYVGIGPDRRDCFIVDAGFSPEPLIGSLQEQGLVPSRLVLTHTHLDHIAGVAALKEIWPAMEIVVHRDEAAFLDDPAGNLSQMCGMEVRAPEAEKIVEGGEELELAGVPFKVFHTPGHSPGGICFYAESEGLCFTGDTLFQGSVGRYDFPASDGEALLAGIRNHLMGLPPETRVLPGHGPESTIGDEERGNPFLR